MDYSDINYHLQARLETFLHRVALETVQVQRGGRGMAIGLEAAGKMVVVRLWVGVLVRRESMEGRGRQRLEVAGEDTTCIAMPLER